MACILEVNGVAPEMGENCWLAPNATVVGGCEIGKKLHRLVKRSDSRRCK